MAKFADVCIQNNPDCAAQQSKRCKSNVKLAKLTPGELSAFCDQIAMILEAGIPIAEGVCLMTAETSNPRFDKILAELSVRLELGHPLHDAMRQTGAFPQYTADMAEIGMLSGRLESVMKALAVYHRREQLIADGIKNAVTYPLTMIAMMTLVILVLIIQVLPVFAGVFVQLGGQMGGLARAMMDFGGRLASSLPFLAVLAALTALFLMITFRSPVWRQRLTVFAAIFAPTKKLSALVATGRFTAALSLMLSSGLDTDQALDMAGKLVNHHPVQARIRQCRKLMESGVSFADAMSQADLFTGLHARMVSVGFKTGAVDKVMEKLADQYDEEVQTRIGSLVSMIEPTLVSILAVVVGVILLSVMLPLIGIMSAIG